MIVKFKFSILSGILVFAIVRSVWAAESVQPGYCNLQTIKSRQIEYVSKGVSRLELFKIGKVHIGGLAVGESKFDSVVEMARRFAPTAGPGQGFCTWYYNDGNQEAERGFNFQYLENPRELDLRNGPAQYRQQLERFFDNRSAGFVSCAENYKYISMGCNGMRHRGPTVFGMLLAFSGCSAEAASDIVNKYWGLNGVKPEVRLAIIKEGTKLAQQYPEASAKLRASFESAAAD